MSTTTNPPSDEVYVDTAATRYVLMELLDERRRQIGVHHWSPSHDDLHGSEDFAWLIARRAVEMCNREAAALDGSRRLFVEIAAIAVAAIEAGDRKEARREAFPHPTGE